MIVTSVLLALAADAWWDGRQERALESEILSAVAEEVGANQSELGQVLSLNQGDLEHIDQFLGATSAELLEIPSDSLRPLLLSHTRTTTFNPVERAALILVQTPVSDSEGLKARTLVSEALRAFSDVLEEHTRLYGHADNVRAILTRHAAARVQGGFEPVSALLAGPGPQVLLELRSDAQLTATLLGKATVQALYVGELRAALAQLDSVGSALRELPR